MFIVASDPLLQTNAKCSTNSYLTTYFTSRRPLLKTNHKMLRLSFSLLLTGSLTKKIRKLKFFLKFPNRSNQQSTELMCVSLRMDRPEVAKLLLCRVKTLNSL